MNLVMCIVPHNYKISKIKIILFVDAEYKQN